MFNPSRSEVRQFFIQAWRMAQAGQPMEPIQLLASQWIEHHPEYHALLADPAVAQDDWQAPEGSTNPFLHLAMHLSISEQCSIDQPPGVRAAVERLTQRLDDLHEAHHQTMEALGQMLWNAQRSGLPPDGAAYVQHLQQLASRNA